MNQIRLFRRRFLPDEITELKNDTLLSLSENILITRWDVLKPREDISNGISAYFIDMGIKLSKIYNARQELVYWYCDIIDSEIDREKQTYVFNDLLIDVLIYPNGHTEVVDMDEFADILEQGTISQELCLKALRSTDYLLRLIYSGRFHELTDYIEQAEQGLS